VLLPATVIRKETECR